MTRAAPLLALLLAGCTAARVGAPSDAWSGVVPGTTTRAELYERLGAPARIDWSGPDRVFRYAAAEAKGAGIGGGYYVTFLFRKIVVATDSLEVRVGPDDVVREARAYRRSPTLERPRPWPFGD